jgi:hypothetical protein
MVTLNQAPPSHGRKNVIRVASSRKSSMSDANLRTPETAQAVKLSFDLGVIRDIHRYQKNPHVWLRLTTQLTMNSIHEKQGGSISHSKAQVLRSVVKALISPAAGQVVGSFDAIKKLGQMYDITGLHAALPVVSAVSLGGFTSAVGPWIAVADIYSAYLPNINKNNLHDIVADASSRDPLYKCSCPKGEDGKTECDHSIEWLIERVEGQLVMKAASVFLAGVPALIQSVYRPLRQLGKRYLSFRSSSSQDGLYPSPSDDSTWQPNAGKCSDCLTELASMFAFYSIGSSSRHHCRVCGYNYCGKCCSYKVAVLNPLKEGGREEGLKEHCLVCNRCIQSAKAEGQSLSNYQTGPLRHTATLKRNATPRGVGDIGCRRAQAALYAIYHGKVDEVLVALIARDGNEHIAYMLGI